MRNRLRMVSPRPKKFNFKLLQLYSNGIQGEFTELLVWMKEMTKITALQETCLKNQNFATPASKSWSEKSGRQTKVVASPPLSIKGQDPHIETLGIKHNTDQHLHTSRQDMIHSS